MVPSLEKYKWFGRFFLEGGILFSQLLTSTQSLLIGAVAPELAKYTSSLLSNPLIMVNHSKYTYTYFQCFNLKVKSWSNLQKRTEILLKDLAKENCDGGKKLKEIWSTNSKYLLSSYLAWMPEVLHDDITKLWPPSIP